MTLLKRKSALWHGLAILLLDWVSGPLKTGAAQFPWKQHTSHQALTLSNALYLWEGWEGGGFGRIQPVPIVATVQLHLSQQQWDYFYKASDSVPRQQSQLKTSAESTLKAEREECMANGFLFVTLLQHLHSSFALRAQPNGLTSAKCVLKRREGPFQRPRSSSRHPAPPLPLHHPPPSPPPAPPPLPPPSALVLFSYTISFSHLLAGWHCYHYTGRIYGVKAYGKNKKASVNTCGKHSVSLPPPPFTGAHSLIRYALIRHIDHRRDSTSPESSHRTFISNGPSKAKTLALLTPADNSSWGDVLLLLNLASAVTAFVGWTIKSKLAVPCCFQKGVLFTHKQQEGRQI